MHKLIATIGVLRTEAGEHFYTDVIAGAALGVLVGLLVPWLHERDELGIAVTGADDGPRLLVAPTAAPGGGVGAALILR